MASAAGLTRDRAADFFGKSTYLRGCGVIRAFSMTPNPSAIACANATRLPIRVAAIGVPAPARSAAMSSVSRERGGTRFRTTSERRRSSVAIFSVSAVAPQIERRWLNGNHHEPCRAHRDPRLGFGVRRSVDHDQIRRTDPMVDPSLEMI